MPVSLSFFSSVFPSIYKAYIDFSYVFSDHVLQERGLDFIWNYFCKNFIYQIDVFGSEIDYSDFIITLLLK